MYVDRRRTSGARPYKTRSFPGIVVLLLLLLTACADNPPAPIEDRNRTSKGTSQRYSQNLTKGKPYSVKAGDSLYAIAFRLGMDFRTLARWNNIPPPYTIYPGQVLQTKSPSSSAKASTESSSRPVSAAKTKTATTPTAASKSAADKSTVNKSTSKQSTSKQSTPKQSTAKPATQTSQAAKTTPPASATKPVVAKRTEPKSTQTQTKSSSSTGKPLGPVSRWLWPSSGTVERKYSSVLHKGVDVKGKRGDPVRATAEGVVVYSGTGVKGYGALLIVKHNEQFLSAYGHNDAILVSEGERVAAGQQIARMGSSGTDSVKLHFEIRRQGKPVDPLKLLPRR